MSTYSINKGIGRTVEFKGLKAQYLFIFAGGLLGILILVMILYMAGAGSYICLFLGAGGALLLVWQTFALNKKYGQHGLMKLASKKRHPRYLISRRTAGQLLKLNTKADRV